MKDFTFIVLGLWMVLGTFLGFGFLLGKLNESFQEQENCILPRNDAQMLNGYNQ